jgi:hypothetical protein
MPSPGIEIWKKSPRTSASAAVSPGTKASGIFTKSVTPGKVKSKSVERTRTSEMATPSHFLSFLSDSSKMVLVFFAPLAKKSGKSLKILAQAFTSVL